MIIGIIGAMEQEVALIRDQLDFPTTWQQAGCNVYCGQLYGINVALVKSGIGKVSAALNTTLLLNYFKPTMVINIGSAGSLTPSLNIGDVVVSNEVRYHDVDVTMFGYEPGQMAQCPASFNSATELMALAEKISDCLNIRLVRGLVVSGDTFIKDNHLLNRIRKTFPKAIAVEMEATAIAHVCYQFTVPFVVIRAISDIADLKSNLNFKKFLTIAVKNSSRVVAQMVQFISKSTKYTKR